MQKGLFVVLEGTDGSGKATQLALLAEALESRGYSVETADFPQYEGTFFGRLVRRYLDGEFGDVGEVSPYLASLTYAGDRWQAAGRIRGGLEDGKIVLANRYRGSNEAHQAANLPKGARRAFLGWLAELELEVYKIPKEDLTIVLYVPPEIGQRLAGNKGEHDIHEKDLEHLERASEMYLQLAEERDDWVLIDCTDGEGRIRSVEAIHADVMKVLESYLHPSWVQRFRALVDRFFR